MSALLELAERCEQATGPDRELDVEIALLIVPGCSGAEHDTNCAGWLRKDGWAFGCWKAPAYTASLDAAMTLVPEGWIVARYVHEGAHSITLLAPDKSQVTGACAATFAGAICAAALRARAAADTQPRSGQ